MPVHTDRNSDSHKLIGTVLVAMAKLQEKKRILYSSCPFVCPVGATRLPIDGFLWNLVFEYFFGKIWGGGEIKFYIRPVKNKGYFTCWPVYIYGNISLNYSYNDKCFEKKICRENQITHFMFNNFFPGNRGVYEIMWKNVVDPDRIQMAI